MNPGDWNEWSRHVLAELKRLDKANEQTHSKLDRYNETLLRNTATLEVHVKRTNLLEEKLDRVDQEVDGLKAHIDNVRNIINLVSAFFSAKGRFVIRLICSAVVLLLGYHLGLKDLVMSFLK